MKPAKFDYHAPTTIDEAVELLARNGPDARVLAGGQTLVPMMNFRLATPPVIIDLNRVAGLAYIDDEQEEGVVRIGAMTRQRAIEFSPVVTIKLRLLHHAIMHVGHLPTRTRGTIGGSIANADPAAEIPMVLLALDGEVVAQGPKGRRTIKASELFLDAMTTSLAPDEILVEVRLPVTHDRAESVIEEFARREGDFAIAAIGAVIQVEDDRCTRARIATAGVSPRPTRLRAAEDILEQDGISEGVIARAAKAAAESVDPMADRHASAAYRRQLTQVLTERAVQIAVTGAARRE